MKYTSTLALLLTHGALFAGDIIVSQPVATESSASSSDWEITSAFYAPLMGMKGKVGLPRIGNVDVDTSFSDLLDVMDAGLSGAVEFQKGPWSIMFDGIWLKLSDSLRPLPDTTVNMEQEQFTGSLSLGYEFFRNDSTQVRFLTGVSFNYMKLDLDLNPPTPLPSRASSGSQSWADPFVGVSIRHELGERWCLFADGLYGGFGVASDEYWQAVAGVGYRLTETTSIALAYRCIAIDYHDGDFLYDTETSGPNIGMILRF